MDLTAQLVPFHCSASVMNVPLTTWYIPAAVHAVAVVHETPLSSPARPLEVDWTSHARPFQRSASVRSCVFYTSLPTAVQAELDVHETPLNSPWDSPAEYGVVSIDQVLPFHPSASNCSAPELSSEFPTATQAEDDVQATPFN